jgi:hypothetical protein
METTSSLATDWEEISRLMGASLPRKESGLKKEKPLPSNKRMDAYNGQTKEILELNPNNSKAYKKGRRSFGK